MLPMSGSARPATQRSRVDFPLPLPATRPIRSPGPKEKVRSLNSGLGVTTPTLRKLMSAMEVSSPAPAAHDGQRMRLGRSGSEAVWLRSGPPCEGYRRAESEPRG